jgi:hypothetical protein
MKKSSIDRNDPSIWYNDEKMREKVMKIRKQFGEPFLITKSGELLYEDCVVFPAFRDEHMYDQQ